jgi:hypothetical protein
MTRYRTDEEECEDSFENYLSGGHGRSLVKRAQEYAACKGEAFIIFFVDVGASLSADKAVAWARNFGEAKEEAQNHSDRASYWNDCMGMSKKKRAVLRRITVPGIKI